MGGNNMADGRLEKELAFKVKMHYLTLNKRIVSNEDL